MIGDKTYYNNEYLDFQENKNSKNDKPNEYNHKKNRTYKFLRKVDKKIPTFDPQNTFRILVDCLHLLSLT